MKIQNLSLLLSLTVFVAVDGISSSGISVDFQNVSNENNQIIKMDQEYQTEDTQFDRPCPNAEDIAPCVCTYDGTLNVMDLECSAVEREEHLEQIFKTDFPFKTFREFKIIGNRNLTVLKSSIFSDISFEIITITNSAFEVVETNALDSCYDSAVKLDFYQNKLTTFPFNDIYLFLKLSEFSISHNYVSTIPVDAFHGLSTLEKFYAQNNNGTFSGTFRYLPNIVELYLGFNDFSTIPANFFKTGSPNLKHIELFGNHIISVEPDAFDILEGLIINLTSNFMTTLEETTWRTHLEAGGELHTGHNPLNCGCDLAWLFREDHLLDQVSQGATCNNGEYIHELDPKIFDLC